MNRIRSFINEKRKITLTSMLIPDASRKTRSWRLPLLRIYALVGVATVLMGVAVDRLHVGRKLGSRDPPLQAHTARARRGERPTEEDDQRTRRALAGDGDGNGKAC